MQKDRRQLKAQVYRITNLVNGKFYIGITTHSLARRLSGHLATARSKKHVNGAFQRAIRKYGPAAFVIEKIMDCETAEQAMREEVRLIAELQPHYNSTTGGEGSVGHVKSPEALAKIGAVSRGNTYRKGKTHSAEVKAILRELGLKNIDTFRQYQALGSQALARPVLCETDNAVFESASAAARHYNVAKSAIIELCRGQRGRKTVGGHVFRYVSKEEAN